jgi:hypothetical protein
MREQAAVVNECMLQPSRCRTDSRCSSANTSASCLRKRTLSRTEIQTQQKSSVQFVSDSKPSASTAGKFQSHFLAEIRGGLNEYLCVFKLDCAIKLSRLMLPPRL